MRKLLVGIIKLYQLCISPVLGNNCRFTPSCSSYSVIAIEKYGVFKGVYLSFVRLLHCHPWCEGGHDPVP